MGGKSADPIFDRKKYIIYGTGRLAEQFYEKVKENAESDKIVYFMETVKTKETYSGKPVLSAEELRLMDFSGYRFVISSESYGEEMKQTLLSIGVDECSIAFVGEYLKKAKAQSDTRDKLNIFIDITDGCNLNCIFCSRDNYDITYMKTADFEAILQKLDGKAGSLQLSCAWEYSIAKNSEEIIEALGKYDVGTTTIYTNGNILPEKLATAMIKAKLDNLVFSIGEASRETYERIRKGGRFERVKDNIKGVRDLKKRCNSNLPRLCVNMTLIKSNIEELEDFVDLAHELGIEEIRGRHLILNEGLDMDAEVIDDQEKANEIIIKARKRSEELGIKFNIPLYSEKTNQKTCRAAWTQLYISSNGDVSICPRIHIYDTVGNIIKDDLPAILGGSKMTEVREMFETNRFDNPVCEICIDNQETRKYINQGF